MKTRFIWLLPVLFMSAVGLLFWTPNFATTEQKKSNDIWVIFDMNGVVFQTSGATKLLLDIKNPADEKQTNILSIFKLIKFASAHSFRPSNLQKIIRQKLFVLFHKVLPPHPHEVAATDEDGNRLPQLMCNWLKGHTTGPQAVALIEQELEKEIYQADAHMLRAISIMIFTPHLFIKTQTPIAPTLEFIAKLKEHGCKICLLSNLASHDGQLLIEKFPEIFALFDHIIFSGDVGLIKPDPALFQHTLERCGICSEQAFFIDDQVNNVVAAQNQCGITSALLTKNQGLFKSGVHIEAVKNKFYTWVKNLENKNTFNLGLSYE